MGDHNDFPAFVLGFIIGGLTGAFVSLLLAPKSGEETRAYLKDKAIELNDKASEFAEKTYSQAEDAAIEARAKADQFTKMAKEKADDLQQRGQVLLEEQKSKIANKIDAARQSAKPQDTGEEPKPAEA